MKVTLNYAEICEALELYVEGKFSEFTCDSDRVISYTGDEDDMPDTATVEVTPK